MIIIQSQAEERLSETLEAIKSKSGHKRCLWIELSQILKLSLPLSQAVVTEVCRLFQKDDCLLFCLENKDIVMIGNSFTDEQRQMVHEMVQLTLDISLPENITRLYDLSVQWGKVAVMTEEAITRKHERIQRSQKDEEEKQRQRILAMKFDPVMLQRMREKRRQRQQVEVMVVEDDLFSRRMVRNVLEKLFSVTVAENGQNALNTYVTTAPDIIFLDIELPDISGHDVCRKLKEIDPDAYIVMLSGNGDRQNITRAIEQGASGFVGKPFTREKLLQYIEKCKKS